MKERIKTLLLKLLPFLPAIIGIFLITWINNTLMAGPKRDTGIVVIFFVLIAILFLSRKAWIQTMELFGKSAFLAPIFIAIISVIWLKNHVPSFSSYVSMSICIIFLMAISMRHWWRMARDEEYKKEDQNNRKVPLRKRKEMKIWSESLYTDMIIMIIFGFFLMIISYFF